MASSSVDAIIDASIPSRTLAPSEALVGGTSTVDDTALVVGTNGVILGAAAIFREHFDWGLENFRTTCTVLVYL